MGREHGALLQPHRVRRVARSAAVPGRAARGDPGGRGAGRARTRRRRAQRLPGRGGRRRGGARDGRPRQGAEPLGGLLLRPGDGRRGPGHVRAARASPR